MVADGPRRVRCGLAAGWQAWLPAQVVDVDALGSFQVTYLAGRCAGANTPTCTFPHIRRSMPLSHTLVLARFIGYRLYRISEARRTGVSLIPISFQDGVRRGKGDE